MCLLSGRAVGVGAFGNFDLRDEAEGLDGGVAMKQYADELKIKGEADVNKRVVISNRLSY